MTSRPFLKLKTTIGFEVPAADPSTYPIINLRATGERIHRLRIDAGLSVRELSRLLFLSDVQAVYKWQRGESLPSLDNLVLLSWLLGVTIDQILVVEFRNN